MAGDAMFGTGTGPHGTGLKERTFPAKDVSKSTTDQDLISRLVLLFNRAKDHRRAFIGQWEKNYKLVHNKQGPSNTSSWVPTPRDSEIYPHLSALVAWMTDQPIEIDLIAASNPQTPYAQQMNNAANDLAQVLRANWNVEDYAGQIKLALWDAFQYSVAIFKTVWDNSLSDGMGNAMLKRVDPFMFYPDPNATSMDDAEYMIEARRMTWDEVERRFPDTVHKIKGDDGDALDERPDSASTSSGKDSPLNTANFGPVGAGQQRWSKSRTMSGSERLGVTVYEFWIRENIETEEEYDDYEKESEAEESPSESPALSEKHIKDSWRCIVMANREILLDEYAIDLWSHASHPYERYAYDDTGEFYPIALVDHLAHPQIYINRLLTALQQNAELVGNPILIEPKAGGTSRTQITNRPGTRIPVNNNSGQKPEWLQPPSMPQSVMDLVNFWIGRMENISGLSAIVKGATPTARNAEGVMTSIQEAAFVRIRSAQRNLESTLERASRKLADLIVDNYTDPRIMAIIGPDTAATTLILHARHFEVPTEKGAVPLKYTLQFRAGSTRPTSRQARMAEADKLLALGAVDDVYTLGAYEVPHAQEIIKRKDQRIQQGLFNPPGARQRSKRQS